MAVDQEDTRFGMSSNGVSASSLGEYISEGASTLDIGTKLRITEAELTIVRNEVSELVAEKNGLEVKCKKHENSWKFALAQLGRTIEERNEALAQLSSLTSLSTTESKSPEMKVKKMKAPALKIELENCLQQLETQNRVARQIEHERDKANDELEFAKSQISTLMMQHADLMSTCTELEAERKKAVSESRLLRDELHRYDKELHNAIESELGNNDDNCTEKEKALLQQIRVLRDEKHQLQQNFQQTVDHYKRQISKCNMDRRQTSTSADAMKALLQRRLETAQSENAELRYELRASSEVITQLKDQLAQVRIACQHHNGYSDNPTQDDITSDSQTSQGLLHVGYHVPPLSQDTGMSLYNNNTDKVEGTSLSGTFSLSSELITPGNTNVSGPRANSARGVRKNPYKPTASPFPEESREGDTSEEEASWI